MPFVADTHSLVWYMTDDSKLSAKAKEIFQRADDSREQIFIPCIVFFELMYLAEKKRIVCDFEGFLRMVSSSDNYRVEPLCLPVIRRSKEIPRYEVPDPWDRLIAATSLHLRLPLITRDEKLRKIGLDVIW